MPTVLPDIERLRPAGTKRSSKRDLIVNVFLRQEGHLSADDLVDLIKREDHRISRATVYRTLQWMVDAGIARKVDFGEGRFRFEHSYRHPRHFHLICKACNRSYEFLSSDIESLVEEVAAARGFTAAAERRADLRHLRVVPHRPAAGGRGRDERAAVRARCAAHRDRDRAQRARVLHAGGAHHQGSARARRLPAPGGGREAPPRHAREALPEAARAGSAARIAADVPVLQGRGQRPVRPRAPTSCYATASTIARPTRSASAASAARTASSSGMASASRTPRASRSSSSSPRRSASISRC